jgi:tyrosyl-tRNA synthetase
MCSELYLFISINNMEYVNNELTEEEFSKINIDLLLENIVYINGDIKKLIKTKSNINILWGLQPRNVPTIDTMVSIMQIIKFLNLGYKVTILLANIHELLDSPNLNLDIIQHRCNAYKELILLVLEFFNVNSNIEFIVGGEFQTSPEYIIDLYKISSMTTIKQTYAAREIDSDYCEVPQSDKKMTTMLYPILQALDEKYTKCDIFYGSITQRNMCEYSINLMKNFRKNDKNVVYLLQDLTIQIDISFFSPNDTIEMILEEYSDEKILYLIKFILFPIIINKGDTFIINDKSFTTCDEFIKYCEKNNYNKNDKNKLIASHLSKYLDKLYDGLITYKFMDHYKYGWMDGD